MKQRFSTRKSVIKNLLIVNEKKLGLFEIKSDNVLIAGNKKMFEVELLANSAVVCNCYTVLNMPSIFTFHIAHIS